MLDVSRRWPVWLQSVWLTLVFLCCIFLSWQQGTTWWKQLECSGRCCSDLPHTLGQCYKMIMSIFQSVASVLYELPLAHFQDCIQWIHTLKLWYKMDHDRTALAVSATPQSLAQQSVNTIQYNTIICIAHKVEYRTSNLRRGQLHNNGQMYYASKSVEWNTCKLSWCRWPQMQTSMRECNVIFFYWSPIWTYQWKLLQITTLNVSKNCRLASDRWSECITMQSKLNTVSCTFSVALVGKMHRIAHICIYFF